MYIIMNGNKKDKKEDRQKVFTCQNCGCVYSANEDEYYAQIILNGTGTVYANCPECYKMNSAKIPSISSSTTIKLEKLNER